MAFTRSPRYSAATCRRYGARRNASASPAIERKKLNLVIGMIRRMMDIPSDRDNISAALRRRKIPEHLRTKALSVVFGQPAFSSSAFCIEAVFTRPRRTHSDELRGRLQFAPGTALLFASGHSQVLENTRGRSERDRPSRPSAVGSEDTNPTPNCRPT